MVFCRDSRRNRGFVKELFMKIEKRHIITIVLGLIPVVILYFVLEYHPFGNTNHTEQKRSMPDINDSHIPTLDDIRFIELQIGAVTIDMYRYIGWFFDNKEMLKKASAIAIHDLGTINDYLQKISFSGDLVELRDSNLTIIDMLIRAYNHVETKQEEEIRKSFDECSEIYCQYLKKFKEYSQIYHPVEELPKDIAFTQNTDPNEVGGTFDIEKEIDLLSEILDSRIYSPVLFDVFCKWRTQTQIFWGGMSNRSNIPNWEYNLKRWKVVQTIKNYIETNPADDWAKAQVRLLLGLPNIGRGGHFGNDVLSYWGDEIEKVEHE